MSNQDTGYTSVQYTMHMDAGSYWQRTISAETVPGVTIAPCVDARMQVRNAQEQLVLGMYAVGTQPTITINPDGSLVLTLTSALTAQFGQGFSGVVQSVGYWGIGRAYLYDLFVLYTAGSGEWTRIVWGTIQVNPAVSAVLSFPGVTPPA